ncbi:hypothetical protein Tco_0659151 [Tanacetum coccineum]
MPVLKSSGCALNYETMDLRSTKFRCIVTIKVLLLYAVIVFNTRDPSTLISVTTSSIEHRALRHTTPTCYGVKQCHQRPKELQDDSVSRVTKSNGHTVADSIGERLKQPTAYNL